MGGRQRFREALAPPLPCLQPAPGPAERSLHIPPPSPGSVCRAIALDFGFLQTYQY